MDRYHRSPGALRDPLARVGLRRPAAAL